MTDDEIMQVATSGNHGTIDFARAIIAAYQARLLAGVEMPEPEQVGIKEVDWNDFEPSYAYTADQLHQYAAAAAAQARMKALDEANGVCVSEHGACWHANAIAASMAASMAAQRCAAAIEKLKGGE